MLAGEILRGIGGILLNKQGRRFCDELGDRQYVTDKMLADGSGETTLETSGEDVKRHSKRVEKM